MRKKYRKYKHGGIQQLRINAPTMPINFGSNFDSFAPYRNFGLSSSATSAIQGTGNTALRQTGGTALNAAGNLLGTYTSSLFGDSELGQQAGGLVGGAVGNAFSTMSNNLLKPGVSLTQGLGQNVGASVAGAGLGIAGNYIGKGVTKALGNSRGGRFLGQGVASTIGGVGGMLAGNAIQGTQGVLKGLKSAKAAVNAVQQAGNVADGAQAGLNAAKFAAGANIAGIAGQVVGSALESAFGKSHAYGGKYGKITQGMDTAYDMIQSGVSFIPGVGQLISGAMAINKGLTNAFGSTDGMTKQDAIFGSALNPLGFLGNWINMSGAQRTHTFNNQSWQNTERADSFMQDSFGNLGKVFENARSKAGKVYGLFSRKKFNKAQDLIARANNSWSTVLDMANQNEYQNIRANDMASVNTDLYTQMIQGGLDQIARGKNGMKMLSFATTGGYQDTGMRLLSGAALNSSGMRMLSNAAI